MNEFDYDVSIIGAGPSGAIAAALLVQKGYRVCVLERQKFPRFSIGESLLPQCMAYIEEAGMLDAVNDLEAQRKDGAVFHYCGQKAEFDFANKSSEGPSETFQVIRADFDKALIDEAVKQGAVCFYETTVHGVSFSTDGACLNVSDADGERSIRSHFCLDASGFGCVLSRLLDLDLPSNLPSRVSYFTHIEDNITSASFNRDRILITVHPQHKDIWLWLIPFSNGTASLGVVGEGQYFSAMEDEGSSPQEILESFANAAPQLKDILFQAKYNQPVQRIEGYSCSVKSLYGDSYALLGNAGEFLDPVFSSGVTIAMKSASLAANLLDKQFRSEKVCWQSEYVEPLMLGVDSFRAFVDGWYNGSLIDIFFSKGDQSPVVTQYLSAILAGYAWDENNPYVVQPARRLKLLVELCK